MPQGALVAPELHPLVVERHHGASVAARIVIDGQRRGEGIFGGVQVEARIHAERRLRRDPLDPGAVKGVAAGRCC